MDQSKAAMLQMQVKHNAADLEDYMKGLDDWEKDIKIKDSTLEAHKPILKEDLPPVRSRQAKSSRSKEKKKKVISSKKLEDSRISSYDYHSWDKFDVEKACEEIDYEVQSLSSSESSDEEDEEDQRRQRANVEKEKGNEFFKKGEYEVAVECYASAMKLDPSNAILPSNRAMALLKLDRYGAAEKDCSLAIELDPNSVKAFLRRGTSRVKLKKYREAREDFESILKMEKSNKLAASELEKLDKILGTSGMRYLRPVKRPPHLRSKKPLKHIFIEDIGSEIVTHTSQPSEGLQKDSNKSTLSDGNKTTSHIQEMPGDSPSYDFNKSTPCDSNKSTSCDSVSSKKMVEEIAESSSIQPATSQSDPLSANVSQETSNGRTLQDNSDNRQTKMAVTHESDKPGSIKVEPPEEDGEGSVYDVPPVPHTSMQFQADWKQMKRNKKMQSQYFKSIPVTAYPLLFQQSLETNTFEDFLNIFHEDFVKPVASLTSANRVIVCALPGGDGSASLVLTCIPELLSVGLRCGALCLDELRSLTEVKRFNVAVMFLSKRQKTRLAALFKDMLKLSVSDEDKQTVTNLAKYFAVTINI